MFVDDREDNARGRAGAGRSRIVYGARITPGQQLGLYDR
jgi:hypothetical protein